MKSIDCVISLGAWCQTAFQIERYFGVTWNSPYSWTVTPFRALLKSIKDRGERLGVSFSAFAGGQDVLCNEYGLLYHHEFPRNTDSSFRFDAKTLENCRSKMTHQFHTMQELAYKKRPMFIRFGGAADPPKAWPYHKESDRLMASQLTELAVALTEVTSNNDFILAFVYHPEHCSLEADSVLDKRVLPFAFDSFRLEDLPQEGWKGNDRNWDCFFEHCRAVGIDLPARRAV